MPPLASVVHHPNVVSEHLGDARTTRRIGMRFRTTAVVLSSRCRIEGQRGRSVRGLHLTQGRRRGFPETTPGGHWSSNSPSAPQVGHRGSHHRRSQPDISYSGYSGLGTLSLGRRQCGPAGEPMGRITQCERSVEASSGPWPAHRHLFDYLTSAIRHYYDSGSLSLMSVPLAVLAAVFDRLGLYEPAATLSGFAATPLGRVAVPEIITAISHLREVLGDQTYDSLARKGEAMTNAAIVAYAYAQIDQARAELNTVSE
jgi:hypothetical protein